MAQATSLALGRTATTSSSITVTTTPVTVSLFSDAVDGTTGFNSIGGSANCPIVLDAPAAAAGHTQLSDENGQPVLLNQNFRTWVLTAPGVYYVVRPLIPSTEPQIGVAADTAA